MKTILLLLLTMFSAYGLNCSTCYNSIMNSGMGVFCSKVLQEDCSLNNLENNPSGISFCGWIVNNPC